MENEEDLDFEGFSRVAHTLGVDTPSMMGLMFHMIGQQLIGADKVKSDDTIDPHQDFGKEFKSVENEKKPKPIRKIQI